jgi:hypothetical protein
MNASKKYAILAWQLGRIEHLIQILERDYSSFLDHCDLRSFGDGRAHRMVTLFHNIKDVKHYIQEINDDNTYLTEDGQVRYPLRPQVHELEWLIVRLSRFIKQCQSIVKLQRAFRHRYYQPDGPGYHQAHKTFIDGLRRTRDN